MLDLYLLPYLYHTVALTRQNRLKVGTHKPKLKVKKQSVSDDDVRKRLLEKPRSELAAKSVFRQGRCYVFRQGIPGLCASNWKSTATDGWSLYRWHQNMIDWCVQRVNVKVTKDKGKDPTITLSQGLIDEAVQRRMASLSLSEQLQSPKNIIVKHSENMY